MTVVEIRPRAVSLLTALLVLTAAATVVVEALNYRYAPERGLDLTIRTVWALLRTLGWLILIWHVRRGRSAARPFGLILAVTTIFAVGRLVVPRTGAPPPAGIVGFAVLTVLCLTVVLLLYRYLDVTGPPRHDAWLLTARVSAFTYSPLMLVPAVIAIGELPDRPEWILAVLFWLAAGIGASYVVLLTTFFLMRGKPWARRLLLWETAFVLVIDLPLCYLLLGADGLIRDGAPLVVAACLVVAGVTQATRRGRAGSPGAMPRATQRF